MDARKYFQSRNEFSRKFDLYLSVKLSTFILDWDCDFLCNYFAIIFGLIIFNYDKVYIGWNGCKKDQHNVAIGSATFDWQPNTKQLTVSEKGNSMPIYKQEQSKQPQKLLWNPRLISLQGAHRRCTPGYCFRNEDPIVLPLLYLKLSTEDVMRAWHEKQSGGNLRFLVNLVIDFKSNGHYPLCI